MLSENRVQKYIWIIIISLINYFIASPKMIREPAVAGIWYPADFEKLQQEINGFLNNVPFVEIKGRVFGLIVPHAGIKFSGQVASFAYKILEKQKINTAIIIGPSHFKYFKGAAVYNKGTFKTPLGLVEIDELLAEKISKKDPIIKANLLAHREEHSIEVQIPFLQKVVKNIKIVPILIGDKSLDTCHRLANAIFNSIEETKTIVIASTDLSHYHSQDEAEKLDKKTIEAIKSLDEVTLSECELCGQMPVITIMLLAKKKNIKNIEILEYTDSSKVTGDKSEVVGYVSAVIYDEKISEEETIFTSTEQKQLFEIARKTLEKYVKYRRKIKFKINNPKLQEKKGVFVTLTKDGNLRGCIGYIIPVEPLYLAVKNMTIAAATQDPRFFPLTEEELKRIKIEISVLGKLKKIENIEEIKIGKHGLFLKKSIQRRVFSGLLLPQVAVTNKWDRIKFLEQVCRKAGLSKNAWQENAEIYIFTAEIFHE